MFLALLLKPPFATVMQKLLTERAGSESHMTSWTSIYTIWYLSSSLASTSPQTTLLIQKRSLAVSKTNSSEALTALQVIEVQIIRNPAFS